MTEWRGPESYATASTPRTAHVCNCIGCCPRCGTCRTWHGHTPDYCALLQRQAREREAFLLARAVTQVDVIAPDTKGSPD